MCFLFAINFIVKSVLFFCEESASCQVMPGKSVVYIYLAYGPGTVIIPL